MKEIFTRHSVRRYEDRPVEQEKIELLLKAAMAAPTAGDQKEWEFVVVTDPDTKKAVSKASPYAGCAAGAVCSAFRVETFIAGEAGEGTLVSVSHLRA